ncbi:MAG: OmpA family protein [Acidimicrobiales bacterium]|nr:OmpA family protein [Acidimicrobiales bacterium]
MNRPVRANPPHLDPGRHVVGEDAPPWIAATAAVMGMLLIAAGVWALNGGRGRVEASPAPRSLAPERSMPTSTATAPAPTTAIVPTVPAVPTTVPAAMPAPRCPAAVAVWFPAGSSIPQLDPASLAEIVAWLMEQPTAPVVVRGHASAVGDDRTNLLLSYERARQVSGTLTALGVPPGRIVIRAAGALEPVAEDPNDPTNQRVVIEPASADCGAP